MKTLFNVVTFTHPGTGKPRNDGLFADIFETDDPAAAFEIRGFPLAEGRCGGNHLREELRGKPCFVGLAGPMWGGWTEDGKPIIRYEDGAACDILSR